MSLFKTYREEYEEAVKDVANCTADLLAASVKATSTTAWCNFKAVYPSPTSHLIKKIVGGTASSTTERERHVCKCPTTPATSGVDT